MCYNNYLKKYLETFLSIYVSNKKDGMLFRGAQMNNSIKSIKAIYVCIILALAISITYLSTNRVYAYTGYKQVVQSCVFSTDKVIGGDSLFVTITTSSDNSWLDTCTLYLEGTTDGSSYSQIQVNMSRIANNVYRGTVATRLFDAGRHYYPSFMEINDSSGGSYLDYTINTRFPSAVFNVYSDQNAMVTEKITVKPGDISGKLQVRFPSKGTVLFDKPLVSVISADNNVADIILTSFGSSMADEYSSAYNWISLYIQGISQGNTTITVSDYQTGTVYQIYDVTVSEPEIESQTSCVGKIVSVPVKYNSQSIRYNFSNTSVSCETGTVYYDNTIESFSMQMVETYSNSVPHKEGTFKILFNTIGSFNMYLYDNNMHHFETVQLTIQEHQYDNGTVIRPKTCKQHEIIEYTCRNCGNKKQVEGSEYGEHNYGDLIVTQEATCIEQGMKAHYKCLICNKYFDADKNETTEAELVIEPVDHTYEEDYTIDKEPTCTENGFKSIYCAVCGTVKDNSTVTINNLGHEYGDLVAAKEATCTESGMKAYYQCSRCNKYFDADKNETTGADLIIEPIGHAYGDLVEEMPATCTEDGVSAHYQCSRCEQYFDINKNKTTREALTIKAAHQYGKLISKNATCTEDGLKGHYQCSVCEKYFDSNKRETTLEDLVIPAAGHQYGSVLGNVPATCTEDGMEPYYQCSKCRKYFDLQDNEKSISEFIIKAFGHSYEMVKDTEKAPTCIYEGKEADWKCSGCGDYIEGEKIKALGHDWGEWEETEPSSCIQEGEMARKCKNDPNHVQYKGIDKLSHVMNKIPLVKATDKSEGINECWQCSLCKRYFSDMSGAIRIGKEDIIIPRHKMTVKVLKKVFTAKAKKKTTIKRSKAFAVYDAKKVNLEGGVSFNVIDNVSKKVTYKKTSGGNKKIVVSKNGNITIKKGLKKGKTYKVRVKVTLKASALYSTCSKTVTVKIKIK